MSATRTASIHRVCFDCGHATTAGGQCPTHPEEPLLDPLDVDVIAEMEGSDSRRQDRLLTIGTAAGAVFGLAYATPIAFIWFSEVLESSVQLFAGLVLLLAAPGMGLGVALGRRAFKPRFAEWTGHLHAVEADAADVEAVNADRGKGAWP